MRVSRMLRTVTVGLLACGIVATGGGTAFAVMTDPPACEQDINGGCLGGPGGMTSPGGAVGTDVGRSFLTDDDVSYVLFNMMETRYVAAEWDSWVDFEQAMVSYWNLNAPYNRSCSIVSTGAASGASDPCDSISFNYYPNADGSVNVTMIPQP